MSGSERKRGGERRGAEGEERQGSLLEGLLGEGEENGRVQQVAENMSVVCQKICNPDS